MNINIIGFYLNAIYAACFVVLCPFATWHMFTVKGWIPASIWCSAALMMIIFHALRARYYYKCSIDIT